MIVITLKKFINYQKVQTNLEDINQNVESVINFAVTSNVDIDNPDQLRYQFVEHQVSLNDNLLQIFSDP